MFRILTLLLLAFQLTLFAEEAPKETPPAAVEQQQLPLQPEMTVEEERPQPPSYEGAFVKMILVLGLLLFIIFFVIWVVRRLTHARMGLFKDTKHIRIIDRRPLSPKTALYLLEIAGEKVLVAESQLDVKRLANITSSEEEA